MWKVGLIGTGYWSANHLTAWRDQQDATVTALCDVNEAQLHRRGELFGIPRDRLFTDSSEMLEKADIDIVDILTPPGTHPSLVKQAAGNGKHLLCIKPLSESLEAAREMAADARRSGVRAMVSENWRWLAPLRRLKELLNGALIGRQYYAKYTSMEYATPLMNDGHAMDQPVFRTMPRLLLFEMGTHWFDVWRFLFGEPDRIYAETRRISPYISGEDLAVVSLSKGDFLGLVEVSWASRSDLDHERNGEHETLIVEGESGTIVMEAAGNIRLIQSGQPARVLVDRAPYDMVESIKRMQAHFLECLDSGEPFETEIDDNLKTLRLVFAAYSSAERHEAMALQPM